MYSSLRALSRSIRLMFWAFTGWWTVTMRDLSTNRTEERTTSTTGRVKKNFIHFEIFIKNQVFHFPPKDPAIKPKYFLHSILYL